MRPPKESFFRRRVVGPLVEQLRQGASPEALAAGCALGAVIGVNPILGSTTALCLAAGVLLRLNHVALQVSNHALYPLQLALLPVFVRAGERVFGLSPVPLHPVTLTREFVSDTGGFLRRFGFSGLAGLAVWAAAGVPAGFALRAVLAPVFRRIDRRIKEARS